MSRLYFRLATAAAIACCLPAVARPQAVLKVNDSISVRIGFLSQTWADFTQNVRQDSAYAQNIFQRRLRFIAGVQVGPHLSFFFQTDNPNLGRSGPGFSKQLGGGFISQDAFAEVKPGRSNALLLDAGLQLRDQPVNFGGAQKNPADGPGRVLLPSERRHGGERRS